MLYWESAYNNYFCDEYLLIIENNIKSKEKKWLNDQFISNWLRNESSRWHLHIFHILVFSWFVLDYHERKCRQKTIQRSYLDCNEKCLKFKFIFIFHLIWFNFSSFHSIWTKKNTKTKRRKVTNANSNIATVMTIIFSRLFQFENSYFIEIGIFLFSSWWWSEWNWSFFFSFYIISLFIIFGLHNISS